MSSDNPKRGKRVAHARHLAGRSRGSAPARRSAILLLLLLLLLLVAVLIAGCGREGRNPVARAVGKVTSLFRRAPEEEPVVSVVVTEDDTLWAEEDSIWAEGEARGEAAAEEMAAAAEQPPEEMELAQAAAEPAPEGEEVGEPGEEGGASAEVAEEISEEAAAETPEEEAEDFMKEVAEELGEEMAGAFGEIVEELAGEAAAKAEPPEVEEAKLAELFGREDYYYQPRGRRDPFLPVSPTEGGLLALDPANLRLIGTVRGPRARIGLFKDRTGTGYVLRQGDRVAGGYVAAITEDSVVFELTQFGAVSRITLSLGVGEE